MSEESSHSKSSVSSSKSRSRAGRCFTVLVGGDGAAGCDGSMFFTAGSGGLASCCVTAAAGGAGAEVGALTSSATPCSASHASRRAYLHTQAGARQTVIMASGRGVAREAHISLVSSSPVPASVGGGREPPYVSGMTESSINFRSAG